MGITRYVLNRFEKWILRGLLMKAVRQSQFHQRNIEYIYNMLYECVSEEFTEDSSITLEHFMSECFQKSLKCHTVELKYDEHIQNKKVTP